MRRKTIYNQSIRQSKVYVTVCLSKLLLKTGNYLKVNFKLKRIVLWGGVVGFCFVFGRTINWLITKEMNFL